MTRTISRPWGTPRTRAGRRPRWTGPLAGIVAAVAAIGVAELIAAFTGARSAPLVAVGGVVVDSVPGPVKNFAVATFGTHDKTALIIGTCVLLGLFAAGIGALSRRDVRYGLVGIGVFGAVGAAAAVTRPGATLAYPIPSLLGAVAGGVMLVVLLRLAGVEAPDEPDGEDPGPDERWGRYGVGERPDRRRFLLGSAGALVGSLGLGLVGRQLGERRNVSAARAAVTLPQPASPAPALPAGADLHVDGLASYVSGNGDFYRIDTAIAVPQVDPATWRLSIHGKVRKPITITFDELMARPMIERYVTLTCVSNEVGGNLIGNAKWLGVPVRDLLEEAGPLPGADQVVGRSVDGFTAGAPTAVLMDGRDAMLAVGMNGQPLPIEHGFPVRMVVPGLYGYVSATKWITELQVTTFDAFDAYWVPRGWSQQAPIKTESRIDTPRDGGRVRAGRVTVAGVAWAQHRGVSRVEVRVDNGPWQEATLAAVPSIDTWRQWLWQWDATPGKHHLSVRATDNGGATQTTDVAPPEPDGATGYHVISVTVG